MWKEVVGFVGSLGWFWRLIIKLAAAALLVYAVMGLTGQISDRYLANSESGYNRRVIRAAQTDFAAVTLVNEDNVRLTRENTRLNGLLADQRATCDQIAIRELAVGQPNAVDATRALAACRLEKSELERTRLTRDACNEEIVSNYNRICRQVCPTAPQLQLQLATPR